MNKSLIKLTPEDIFAQEFSRDAKGYSFKEVNAYLDIVIEDYKEFQRQLLEMEKIIDEKEEEIIELKKEIRNLKSQVNITKTEGINNLDVLTRINRLEEMMEKLVRKDD